MKRTYILLISALTAFALSAQLPQFTNDDFDGWNYNNPNVQLSMTNIAQGRITIYVNSEGLVLTLISPQFQCAGIDTIHGDVKWFTKFFSDSNFDLNKASLTLAIDDENGNPIDSVTCIPTTLGTSTHNLSFDLPVPAGLNTASLRFVSWTGNVVSSGGIKQALFTAVTSTSPPAVIMGDTNGDGTVDITDVTVLIDHLLDGQQPGFNAAAADVDHDGSISIGDVSALIDMLLLGVG